ncbi:MAG: phosphatase PAP2 family protein [Rhodobacteraceae bacterium]|nr:phosphatase PAP2 family protein [Paracoccaceae bacterium]
MRQLFAASIRGFVVMAVILAVVFACGGNARKTGDNLQIALPLLAWGCAAANGDGVEYFGRYVVMFTSAHGLKRAFGDAPFNQRPKGTDKGMPSAHTSTAVLGASRLVSDCVAGNVVVQSAAVLSAGFVGTSRVDAKAHTIWQVLAGAILGLICDRAFGKGNRIRRRVMQRLRGKGTSA